ncbi:hypothetical protein FNU79_14760 [Deinococcus detaillensis]|uniref:Uncharacterized protein n=1 Tax=Deinococcus detaillensis TaxID=2592048 RepID=A0A553UND5_9DEIO|nr:hypothetical protein [Deinococcus detaillensis]TSA81710.1 hypothetical protein FNU79_14760 [Deinococcus detaillensis]
MSTASSSRAVIVQAGAGNDLDLEAVGIISAMLTGKQTVGALTVVWVPVPPDFGTPPGVHSKEDELVHVIDGHVSCFIDGHWTDVGHGGPEMAEFLAICRDQGITLLEDVQLTPHLLPL